MLNVDLMQAWVDALRSGKFRQCKDALFRKSPYGDGRGSFCAVGVLAYLTDNLEYDSFSSVRLKGSSSLCWSSRLSEKLGVEPFIEGSTVAAANDHDMSFWKIADLLERTYLYDSSSYSQASQTPSGYGIYEFAPYAAPTLQEVGFSDSTTPTGSDSSEGEREAYEAEEEEVTA